MRERQLTRHDLGREKFVSEVSLNFDIIIISLKNFEVFVSCIGYINLKVWTWKNLYGGTILQQLRRLGASLDWSREVWM